MTSPRPFRFGVVGESVRSRDDLVETARRAEATGFSTFLLRDHFAEEPFGHQLAPLAALAWAAAVTTMLRVGTLVIANDYRHPVLLAKEAATLDGLSGGRFELGLGAGFARAEYAQAGLAFDAPGVRVGRLAEALRVIKGAWAGRPLTFAGTHYRIAGLDGFPRPAQRPHPPILVGAAGPRMLALAAREADIVGFQTVSTAGGTMTHDLAARLPETLRQRVALVRDAAGERFARLELSMVASLEITDRRDAAAARLARERGWDGLAPADVRDMPSVLVGSVEEIAETMEERRARYGLSYWVLSDRALEPVGPLVARLAGR
jgi:probable F420-dependent oxidoreductase